MGKMIHCAACGKEMAKSAKSCPHCGAKKKPGCLRIALATFLILIGIGLIAGALSDNDEPVKVPSESDHAEQTTQTTQPEEDPVFALGETAEMDGVRVTFVDLHEYSGDFMHPSEGNTYVGFELLIENNSNKAITVSSMMCFEGYFDDFAANYSISAQSESGLNQLDAEIAPGKKMSGAICYEVPADWTTAELHFSLDFGYSEFVFGHSK